jgi:hypothetical protein
LSRIKFIQLIENTSINNHKHSPKKLLAANMADNRDLELGMVDTIRAWRSSSNPTPVPEKSSITVTELPPKEPKRLEKGGNCVAATFERGAHEPTCNCRNCCEGLCLHTRQPSETCEQCHFVDKHHRFEQWLKLNDKYFESPEMRFMPTHMELFVYEPWRLSRVVLARLQNKAAELTSRLETEELTDKFYEEAEDVMPKYAQALRDYQEVWGVVRQNRHRYIEDKRLQDFYRLRSSKNQEPISGVQWAYDHPIDTEKLMGVARIDPLRQKLMEVLPKQLSWSHFERQRWDLDYKLGAPPRTVSHFVDTLARMILSFAAGAALVGPMLVMAINTEQNKSIIVVSLTVVLFAICASLAIKLSNTEIFLATATYAAVMVVFLGVTS